MKTHTTRENAAAVRQYLITQTNERPIVRDYDEGFAVQRCAGVHWDFDASRWDNGCKVNERGEWEKRHDLLTFLEGRPD